MQNKHFRMRGWFEVSDMNPADAHVLQEGHQLMENSRPHQHCRTVTTVGEIPQTYSAGYPVWGYIGRAYQQNPRDD